MPERVQLKHLPPHLRDKAEAILAAAKPPGAKKPSKYGNKKTVVDGVTFDSQKEAKRYGELKLAQAARQCWFLRQVPFHLPGGVKWVCDFLVIWLDEAGQVREVSAEDVKGFRTQVYKVKKRVVEATYPIKIEEV